MSRSREILDNSSSNNSNSVQLERVEKDGGGEANNTDVHMSDIIKGRWHYGTVISRYGTPTSVNKFKNGVDEQNFGWGGRPLKLGWQVLRSLSVCIILYWLKTFQTSSVVDQKPHPVGSKTFWPGRIRIWPSQQDNMLTFCKFSSKWSISSLIICYIFS